MNVNCLTQLEDWLITCLPALIEAIHFSFYLSSDIISIFSLVNWSGHIVLHSSPQSHNDCRNHWLTSDLIHESWVKISLSVKQCEVIILWWSCSSISDTDYTPQRISIQIKIDFIHSLHTWFLFTCLMLTDVSPPSAQCHCVSSRRSKII